MKLAYAPTGKRVLDVVVASLAALAFAPLVAIVALAVRLADKAPAFFAQERMGAGGRRFTLFKIRSMPVDTPTLESAAATHLPLTHTGKILRRMSIDELPQILNVLRGDMSIVGPRPALPSQSRLLELRVRNGSAELRPGITGLAQVMGVDDLDTATKASYDGAYASDVSLIKDTAIVLKTISYLLRPPPTY